MYAQVLAHGRKQGRVVLFFHRHEWHGYYETLLRRELQLVPDHGLRVSNGDAAKYFLKGIPVDVVPDRLSAAVVRQSISKKCSSPRRSSTVFLNGPFPTRPRHWYPRDQPQATTAVFTTRRLSTIWASSRQTLHHSISVSGLCGGTYRFAWRRSRENMRSRYQISPAMTEYVVNTTSQCSELAALVEARRRLMPW